METTREILQNNLKYYLYKSGMKQNEFAEKIGDIPANVNAWVQGKKVPRIEKYEPICKTLGIDIWQLFATDRETPQDGLSAQERYTLSSYFQLNPLGREKALSYISDLAEQEKYREKETDKTNLPWH